jgi:hypothetical protein
VELYKVRDIVREEVGRDRLSDPMLAWCVERGLREMEKVGNFYWMEAVKSFSLVIDQGDYSIYTSTSSGLNIPNYKDSRILFASDQTLSHPDWDEVIGPEQIEEVKLEFADDDEGQPVVWTQKETGGGVGVTVDSTLSVWPPNPDKTYSMELHYFQWTSLPTDITTDTHEVLKRWPEALIYLATEQAILQSTKDMQAAAWWHNLFQSDNPRANTELKKIIRYNAERQHATRIELRPRHGGLLSRRARWRRNREVWL